MTRNKLYLDTDQKPHKKSKETVRCPYCGRILTEVQGVRGASLHRLYCRSTRCKLYFLLESTQEPDRTDSQ